MPAPAHIQAATLDRFIAGWKKWTPEDWMATWSDDCVHRMLPLSLGVPPKSVPEVKDVLAKLMAVLKNYELHIHEIIHDAPQGKAVIYASSRADTTFADGFEWTNEYAIFLSFSENGERVVRKDEMIDTAFYREFTPRFQAHLMREEQQDQEQQIGSG